MIRIDEEKNLVLTPRALSGQGHEIKIPLERAYTCPACSALIYGAFRTTKGEDHLLNLNPYATGGENVMGRPEYKTEFVELPGGDKFQFFHDAKHCGDGKLIGLVNKASGNQCKFVKFYFEPNYRRLFNRLFKDLADIELYGGYVRNKYYRNQADFINGIREKVQDEPERMRKFLTAWPYGRFVPDTVGNGPAGYLVMYRYEHTLIRDFYTKVIEGSHECIH